MEVLKSAASLSDLTTSINDDVRSCYEGLKLSREHITSNLSYEFDSYLLYKMDLSDYQEHKKNTSAESPIPYTTSNAEFNQDTYNLIKSHLKKYYKKKEYYKYEHFYASNTINVNAYPLVKNCLDGIFNNQGLIPKIKAIGEHTFQYIVNWKLETGIPLENIKFKVVGDVDNIVNADGSEVVKDSKGFLKFNASNTINPNMSGNDYVITIYRNPDSEKRIDVFFNADYTSNGKKVHKNGNLSVPPKYIPPFVLIEEEEGNFQPQGKSIVWRYTPTRKNQKFYLQYRFGQKNFEKIDGKGTQRILIELAYKVDGSKWRSKSLFDKPVYNTFGNGRNDIQIDLIQGKKYEFRLQWRFTRLNKGIKGVKVTENKWIRMIKNN